MNKHALAILIGLALAGCNSGSNHTSATKTTTPAAQQTTSAQPSAQPSTQPSAQPSATQKQDTNTQAKPVAVVKQAPVKQETLTAATAFDISLQPVAALKADANDEAFLTSGIPEGVTKVPPVKCDKVVNSIKAVNETFDGDSDQPIAGGQTLCLADGTYEGKELEVNLLGGQKFAAQHPGKAIIKGGTFYIQMGGEGSTLQGLVLDHVHYEYGLINTRFSNDGFCQNCRITEMTIIGAKTDAEWGAEWIKVYGGGTWIDHNIFTGKTDKKPVVSFIREKGLSEKGRAHGIVAYKNYFGNRPPADNKLYPGAKDNDYEGIRTGLSETHTEASKSFVVGNLFENMHGEAEVVSNKASFNTISFNTVRNSYGSLTNRHGSDNTFENNFILGDGYPMSGGLRIVDKNHQINNNYIESARYLSTTHHGGIVLLGYDGADGPTSNGYQQVENVHLSHNTIVDSVNSLNVDGGGKPHQPKQVYFTNNIIDHAIGPVVKSHDRGLPPQSEFLGNILSGQKISDSDKIGKSSLGDTNIFESAHLVKDPATGVYRPTVSTPSLTVTVNGDNSGVVHPLKYDMDGQLRNDPSFIGADEVNANSQRTIEPLTYADVGPVSYHPEKPAPIVVTADIKNSDFSKGTEGWTGNGADTVYGANAFSAPTLQVSDNGAVSQEVTVLPHHKYALSAFVKGDYELAVNEIADAKLAGHLDEYKWLEVPFDSGDNTKVNVSLKVPGNVKTSVKVADADFSDYYEDTANSIWTETDGSTKGLGDVGGSKDSAFSGKGSVRLRFKFDDDAVNDFTKTPSVAQVINGIPANTDMTFSVYYCDKMGDSSLANLKFGAQTATGDAIDNAVTVVHNKDLANAPKGSNKDCFKQAKVSFNSGDNTSVKLFAALQVKPEDQTKVQSDSNYTNGKFEVRLDNFALTYDKGADSDMIANFDEIRLETRTDVTTK
ncbi:chondroitinase-B domain-containing protein [Vibrio rarus]|uniref:chondroitinase-B domain-containing protein n=1 Tax=Vibrio rarus TaxID=413403 RepID=UPI0021C475B0|nr:chondroitinase-B domain-containing protein [Vibrio rarus]